MNEPETIQRILAETKTIAVVGLSDTPGRASLGVSRYLQGAGYRVVPVNPKIETVLGEQSYPTLDAAHDALRAQGTAIDLVDVFRAPSYVAEIVKDVMRLKIPAVWLQLGVCHGEAADWADRAGVLTVMDRCLMQEHAALARSKEGARS